MQRNERVSNGAFRSIGSRGLVIFERDGTLLRRRSPSRSITLGDFSNEFASMLRELRHLNVRFGFISDGRGMDAKAVGRTDFADLTRLLDQLLRVRGAMPDFWISRGVEVPSNGKTRDEQKWQKNSDTELILRAIDWYCVDRKETIYVSSATAGRHVANEIGIAAVQYLCLRDDLTLFPRADLQAREPPFPEARETDWLRVQIQQILGLGNCPTT